MRELEIVPDRFLERYGKLFETPLTTEGRKLIVNMPEALVGEIRDLAEREAKGLSEEG